MNPTGENRGASAPEGDILSQAYFRDKNVADEVQRTGDAPGTILRRLGSYTGSVIFLLIVLDMVLRLALPPETLLTCMKGEVTFYTLKVSQYLEEPTQDLVVLGSSRARKGVNPEALAWELTSRWQRPAHVFNMGLDGGMINEIHSFVTSHMQDPPPPYVVICLSGMEISQAYDFYYAPRFLWSFPNLFHYIKSSSFEEFEVKKVEYFIESLLCRIWYLFEHRDALSTYSSLQLGRLAGIESAVNEWKRIEKTAALRQGLVLSKNGYYAEPKVPMNMQERLERKPKSVPKISDRRRALDKELMENARLDMLASIIHELHERGTRVAIAELPPSPHSQMQRPWLGGRDFRQWMAEQAAALEVPFVAFPPEKSGLSNQLYCDISHLSPEGAIRYSRILAEELCRINFFEETAP